MMKFRFAVNLRAVCSPGHMPSIGQRALAAAQIQFVRYARNMTRKRINYPPPKVAESATTKSASDPMADISAREEEMANDPDVSDQDTGHIITDSQSYQMSPFMSNQMPLPPILILSAGNGEVKMVENLLKAGEKTNQVDSVSSQNFGFP